MQVHEAWSPNQDEPKEAHIKTHHKIAKLKEKERLLKAVREKQLVT